MAFLASLRLMDDIGYDDLEPMVRIAAQAGIKSARRLKCLVAPYLERKERRMATSLASLRKGCPSLSMRLIASAAEWC